MPWDNFPDPEMDRLLIELSRAKARLKRGSELVLGRNGRLRHFLPWKERQALKEEIHNLYKQLRRIKAAHRFRAQNDHRYYSGRTANSAPFSRFRERIQPLGNPHGSGPTNPIGKFKRISNGVVLENSNVNLTGVQVSQLLERTWDSVNPLIRRGKSRRAIYGEGGPFASIKVRVPSMEWQAHGTYSTLGNPNFGSNSRWEYTGSFANPDLTYDGISLSNYGGGGGAFIVNNPLFPSTTAYEPLARDRLRPQLSRAGLTVFLAESRDIPRMLRQTSAVFHDIWKALGGSQHTAFMHPKRVADEFLNHQFGWAPFVGDIVKMTDALIFSRQYIADVTAANNTWVKKRAVLANDESVTRLKRLYSPGCEPSGANILGLCKDLTLDGNVCKGYMDVMDETKTLVWTEGSFKYYRPEFDSSLSSYNTAWASIERHMTLYGLRVNPSTIYRATPWTWLIDWFSQTGRLIDRATDWGLDGIVSKYLYLMHHRVRTIRSFHLFNFWSGALALTWVRFVDTKQRKNAGSPYGFDLLSKDLSTQQWAILAALGISRNVSITRYF